MHEEWTPITVLSEPFQDKGCWWIETTYFSKLLKEKLVGKRSLEDCGVEPYLVQDGKKLWNPSNYLLKTGIDQAKKIN